MDSLPYEIVTSPPTQHCRRGASFLPLRIRVELVCEGPPETRIQITGSADVYEFLREYSARWDRERFLTILLDVKHRVLRVVPSIPPPCSPHSRALSRPLTTHDGVR